MHDIRNPWREEAWDLIRERPDGHVPPFIGPVRLEPYLVTGLIGQVVCGKCSQ